MSSASGAPLATAKAVDAISASSSAAQTASYADAVNAKPVRMSWADMTEEDDDLRAWTLATAVKADRRIKIPVLKGTGEAFDVLKKTCDKIHSRMERSDESGPELEFVPLDSLAEAKWFFGLISAFQGLRKDHYGKPANDFDHGEKVGLVAIISRSEKDREGIRFMLPEDRLQEIILEKAKKLLAPSTKAAVLTAWVDSLVNNSANGFRKQDAVVRERAINAIEVTSRVSAIKHAPTIVETRKVGKGKDAETIKVVRIVNPLPSSSEAQGVLTAEEGAALAPLGAIFQVQAFPEWKDTKRLADWKSIKASYDVVATKGAAIRRIIKERRTRVFTSLRAKNTRKDYVPTADDFRQAAEELKVTEYGKLMEAINDVKSLGDWTKVCEGLKSQKE